MIVSIDEIGEQILNILDISRYNLLDNERQQLKSILADNNFHVPSQWGILYPFSKHNHYRTQMLVNYENCYFCKLLKIQWHDII